MPKRKLFLLSNRHKRRILKSADSVFNLNCCNGLDLAQLTDSTNTTAESVAVSASLNINNITVERNFEDFESESILCDELICVDSSTDIDTNSSDHDDLEESSSECSDEIKLKLQKWSAKHNITQTATSDLLKVLKSHSCFQSLPADARSLLQTPRSTKLREVNPGNYCHLGLENGIRFALEGNNWTGILNVQISIDGIPISKSTKKEWWPILGYIQGTRQVFVIGIYEGPSKPFDIDQYLQEFVDEANRLYKNGLVINFKTYAFKIQAFICDGPARAFICNIKSHSGYYGCSKCTVKGKYIENRVVLTKTNSEHRTDSSFRNRDQPQHHIGPTCLERLPIDMVQCFPFEYMHLICLGITRKLIKLWTQGKLYIFRLAPRVVKKISDKLVKLGKSLTVEFNRKQRRLEEIDRWKATELRTFLFYTGAIALRKYLPENHYQLFMILSVACRILATPKQSSDIIDYAEKLILFFAQEFKSLFGKVNFSYNLHCLTHLVQDVRKYGHLDAYSAFRFENKLGELKKLLRKPSSSLSQVHRRISEKCCISKGGGIEMRHHGSLWPELGRQIYNDGYKFIRFEQFMLKPGNTNGVIFLEDNKVAVITKILSKTKVIAQIFKETYSVYTDPCDSALLTVFQVRFNDLGSSTLINVEDIKWKCVALKSKTKLFIFPLLHSI